MGVLRKFRKSVEKDMLLFPLEMYTNVVGSLVITAYILSDEKPSIDDIKKQWKKLRKNGMNFWLDDPDFIDKTLDIFNMKAPYGYFAMVQSDLNVLFMPYLDEKLLPLREDGIMPNTAYNGKIYPVRKEGKTNILEDK